MRVFYLAVGDYEEVVGVYSRRAIAEKLVKQVFTEVEYHTAQSTLDKYPEMAIEGTGNLLGIEIPFFIQDTNLDFCSLDGLIYALDEYLEHHKVEMSEAEIDRIGNIDMLTIVKEVENPRRSLEDLLKEENGPFS